MTIAFRLLGSLATVVTIAAPGPQPAPAPPKNTANDSGAVATVDAFRVALSKGDRGGALDVLAPDVSIFEAGGAEMSRDEYSSHHLASDISFASATKHEIINRQVRETGDVAWVLTKSRTAGRYLDRDVDMEGTETVILTRSQGQWRIAHIHWSARPRPPAR